MKTDFKPSVGAIGLPGSPLISTALAGGFSLLMTYAEKLRDPRWQKKRLEMLQLYDWKCGVCGDDKSTLHVHHIRYSPRREPWEERDFNLIVLCKLHHDFEHNDRQELIDCLLRKLNNLCFGSVDIFELLERMDECQPAMRTIAEKKAGKSWSDE